jgi:tetratricopeptide (TPR) repeat protein
VLPALDLLCKNCFEHTWSMVSRDLSAVESDWQEKTDQLLVQGNYVQAAKLYEQAIEDEPSVKSHYWQLGLMLLLQGQEARSSDYLAVGIGGGRI